MASGDEPATDGLWSQIAGLRLVLRSVPSGAERLHLVTRVLASRAGPGFLRRIGRDTMTLPLRDMILRFHFGDGELAMYRYLLEDLEAGVIPDPAGAGSWTVVDCGANVGIFSLLFNGAARVVAIEPNPSVVGRLRENLALNRMDATVVQCAVSDHSGSVMMDLGDGPSILAKVSSDSGERVEAITLDELWERESIGTADLLKVDVEGHWREAMAGAEGVLEKGLAKRIYAEYEDDGELAEIERHLGRFGLRRARTGEFNALFELA